MRKIAIFTGNRAEFGLLLPIIEEVEHRSNLELQLLVSGAHLEDDFGKTIELIKSKSLNISAEVEISLKSDDLYSTSIAIGEGIINMTKALNKLRPDLLIVYADRFEGFAAVIAASQMGLPVAHIEGGDLTEGGALDDSVRHAMSKLAHLHFTTNEQAKKVVEKLGEEKWRIFNSGLPSIDHIVCGKFASKDEIEKEYNLNLNKPLVIFTQHSVATEHEKSLEQVKISLEVIKSYLSKGIQFIITYPNNDAGGSQIIKHLKSLEKEQIDGLRIVPSMGAYRYHGALALAKDKNLKVICMGNSSSGIKETPIFDCPTINIGTRQDGRLQAHNVINVNYDKIEISNAIEKCLYDRGFRDSLVNMRNPYGDGKASKIIVDKIEEISIDKKLIQKKHVFGV